MSLEELCQKYDLSPTTVKTKFKRTQETVLRKYGVQIVKVGRGASASYYETETEQRALTLYQEKDNPLFYIDDEIINLDQWELMILIVLLIKPDLVYRGNIKGLLEYLGKKSTSSNISALQVALQNLEKKNYVLIAKDDEDGYFMLGLKRQVEKKIIDIQLDMVKKCYEIAELNNKREWIPILKVWAAAAYYHQIEPFTTEDIKRLTGLSDSAIKVTKKLLSDNNIVKFRKDCISVENAIVCKGSKVDVNGFYS